MRHTTKISGDSTNWKNIVKTNEEQDSVWKSIALGQLEEKNKTDIFSSLTEKMRRFLYLTMDLVLTDLQKECYTKYFSMEESNKVIKIADEMGIKPSTVYKHIRKANEKLIILGELFIDACGYKSYYEDTKKTIKFCLKNLDPDERAVIEEYYINVIPILKIAQKYDLSQDEVYALMKEGSKKIVDRTTITYSQLKDLRTGIISMRKGKKKKRWRFL